MWAWLGDSLEYREPEVWHPWPLRCRAEQSEVVELWALLEVLDLATLRVRDRELDRPDHYPLALQLACLNASQLKW